MADLNSLTLNGVKYDAFPGQPYVVVISNDSVDESDYSNNTYSTTETVEKLSAVLAEGRLLVAKIIGIGPSSGHFESYYMLDLVWYDEDTGRYIPRRFKSGQVMLELTENDSGGFDVAAPYSS